MTIRVAVAGVTNGLGDSISSALLQDSDVELILLTRKSSDTSKLSHLTTHGAIIKSVDYDSIPDITSALNGVDTVISTIWSPKATPNLNLVEAAKSAGVRRFAPAEYAFSTKFYDTYKLYDPKEETRAKLKESGMEYTLFNNGIFMDYLVQGAPKKHEGPLRMNYFVVYVDQRKAIIPGTGDEKITFTTLRDVGRLVAAAVKLKETWPLELEMVGETTTYNQVVREAEAIVGEKFEVQYLDKATILKTIAELKDDPIMRFYNQVLFSLADGEGFLSPVLNNLVPHVAVTSVKGLLEEYWG